MHDPDLRYCAGTTVDALAQRRDRRRVALTRAAWTGAAVAAIIATFTVAPIHGSALEITRAFTIVTAVLVIGLGIGGILPGTKLPTADAAAVAQHVADARRIAAASDGRRALVDAVVAHTTYNSSNTYAAVADELQTRGVLRRSDIDLVQTAARSSRFHPAHRAVRRCVTDPVTYSAYSAMHRVDPYAPEGAVAFLTMRFLTAAVNVTERVRAAGCADTFTAFADDWDGPIDDLIDLATLLHDSDRTGIGRTADSRPDRQRRDTATVPDTLAYAA